MELPVPMNRKKNFRLNAELEGGFGDFSCVLNVRLYVKADA